MARLSFTPQDVRRVVDHAKASPEHRQWYGETHGPKVLLVKDEGIYLMSNGVPMDHADVQPELLPHARAFVAYAKGYNPETDDRMTVWEKARNAVGGDDFSEPLPLDGFIEALTAPDGQTVTSIILVVTAKSITIQSRCAVA